VWDRDTEVQSVPYDLVDEFDFNFNEVAGAEPIVRVIPGVRDSPISE